MGSLFASFENEFSAAVDATFGEDLEHQPMAAAPGGGRRTADPDRLATTIVGVINDEIDQSPISARGASSIGAGDALPHSSRHAWASVDRDQFEGPLPRRFDRIKRIGTGDLYDIADVVRDGEGRMKLRLVLITREIGS